MNYKLFLLSAIFFLVSCMESDKQKAEKLFVEAENLYEQKDLNAAKNTLDSIHAKFPRQVEYRRKADTLTWKIWLNEISRDLPQVDSALVAELAQAEMIAKNYRFQKNEKYQQIGDYEHISMNTAANAGKNYLKPITDEKGNFRFISTLAGQKINHRTVEATYGDLSAQTARASKTDCNSYNDIGVNVESVLFTTENAKNFILFLQDNVNNAVKIILLGDKNFSYNLSKKDLKVFVETFEFSLLLKNIAENQTKKAKMENTAKILQMKFMK